MPKRKNKAAQAMARKRWRRTSPAERSANGRRAALARWRKEKTLEIQTDET